MDHTLEPSHIPTRNPESGPRRNSWQKIEPFLYRGRMGPAFWTVASLFSLAANLILIVILVLVGRELFSLKGLVQNQLVGGLHTNFVKMDQASIITTIEVNDTIQVSDTITVQDQIPVVFDLPLNQETSVVLTRNTRINNTTIYLNGTPISANIVLPKGTPLDIALNLTVPVNQTIPVTLKVPVNLTVPVNLKVPVNIPLNQTELHDPFVGLQDVLTPYNQLLTNLPDSWSETPLCKSAAGWLCPLILGE